jgi:hypothetical protein
MRMPNASLFEANERAPSAAEAHAGARIVNSLGNLSIVRLQPMPGEPGSSVELVGEPPVLRLTHALASLEFGFTHDGTGTFHPYDNEMRTGTWIANGEYAGPGSIIELSNRSIG